jgi:hypothetical protein
LVAAKKQLPGSRVPCSLQRIEVILGLSVLLVPFTLILLLLLFPRAVASCGNSILPLRVALAAAAADWLWLATGGGSHEATAVDRSVRACVAREQKRNGRKDVGEFLGVRIRLLILGI